MYPLIQGLIFGFLLLQIHFAFAGTDLSVPCPNSVTSDLWADCFATSEYPNGDVYRGYWKDGKMHGIGEYLYFNGNRYFGEFKNHQRSGSGIFMYKGQDFFVGNYKSDRRAGVGIFFKGDGSASVGVFSDRVKTGAGAQINTRAGNVATGVWKSGELLNSDNFLFDCEGLDKVFIALDAHLANMPASFRKNPEELQLVRRHLLTARTLRDSILISNPAFCQKPSDGNFAAQPPEKSQAVPRAFSIAVTATEPNELGEVYLSILSDDIIASVEIDGQPHAETSKKKFIAKRLIRAGQDTKITVMARNPAGVMDVKTLKISRPAPLAKSSFAQLDPTQLQKRTSRDAVAVIIGISAYKNFPRADFANDDARVFYDYAIRALGVKAENIRLLVDDDADQAEIYRAFKTWLPSRVRSTTDLYVFYSGHGLPGLDGQELYLLPQRADKDFFEKTAISMMEINAAIQAAKPKSVTVFLDACYSGQSRSGESLIASARPVTMRSAKKAFPNEFTVIAASQADQISSSSADLRHGIFSYYLMRGLGGDADTNGDGKITLGEMREFLGENVPRHAGMMNRKQEPQLIGEASRVLVGD